jgi:hypothetical protein
MSNSSRTKLITFAPYLQIINELDDSIMIAESPARGKYDWKLISTIKSSTKVIQFFYFSYFFKNFCSI